MEIFRNSSPKSRFSKILTKFAQIIRKFDQNLDGSKILNKIEIF